MIDTEGDVFVMDFGLARAVEDSSMTQPGTVMGTPCYMSPEQLAGQKLDERSDVYSIGLILYYCLTGEDLFRADDIAAVIAKHASITVRDVVATNALLPANLQDMLVSMLEEDPNLRARSVREALERLTLRKIVALGLAATEEQTPSTVETQKTPPAEAPEPLPERPEDSRIAAAAERRKARLRSLLDSL